MDSFKISDGVSTCILFYLTVVLWFSPPTSGSSPPACNGCSLTRVDRFRSVFYGGYQVNVKCVRSTHILNMMEWVSEQDMVHVYMYVNV